MRSPQQIEIFYDDLMCFSRKHSHSKLNAQSEWNLRRSLGEKRNTEEEQPNRFGLRMVDSDAESDAESYFLTPANEYDIVEKIQSANSRLISDVHGEEHQATTKVQTNKDLLQPKHRVTFSSDVEEYDDDFDGSDAQYIDDEDVGKESVEINEPKVMSASPVQTDQIDELMQIMAIEENIYPEVSDDEHEYPTRPEQVNDNIRPDDRCHGVAVNSKPIDRIELTKNSNENTSGCDVCAKTDSWAAQQSSQHKRPTSSRPIAAQRSRSKNRIASASTSASANNQLADSTNNLLKIHLNIRTCCEHKYMDNGRLPRYNGYHSQYGLSKDQMEQRKLNHQRYVEQRTRRNREILRAKQEIACLNEQAFRQWLIRKNHSARSKYKNMYDS